MCDVYKIKFLFTKNIVYDLYSCQLLWLYPFVLISIKYFKSFKYHTPINMNILIIRERKINSALVMFKKTKHVKNIPHFKDMSKPT